VSVSEHGDTDVLVGNPSLDPIRVDTRGRTLKSGERAILGVRPQYLMPTDPESGMLHGTVSLTERLGSETVVDVALHDGTNVIAAIAEDRIMKPGHEIGLRFDAAKAHVFPYEEISSRPH
jgi:multiple sugar transport system ATP-binding protein